MVSGQCEWNVNSCRTRPAPHNLIVYPPSCSFAPCSHAGTPAHRRIAGFQEGRCHHRHFRRRTHRSPRYLKPVKDHGCRYWWRNRAGHFSSASAAGNRQQPTHRPAEYIGRETNPLETGRYRPPGTGAFYRSLRSTKP
jgi:hypothetical protein